MSTLGNILWIILGGFIIFLIYLFGSLVLFLTIIGIPFGIQTLKMAVLALAPFGREVRPGKNADGCLAVLLNIIWILVAGLHIAVIHLILALLFGITIVGLPFASQHLKLAYLALVPFGNEIVDIA